MQDEKTSIHNGSHSAEACIVTFYAQVFLKVDNVTLAKTAADASARLDRLATSKIRDIGVSLVVTNISSFISEFCHTSFSILLRHGVDRQSTRDLLPAVHAILVYLHSLYMLKSRMNDAVNTVSSLMNAFGSSWVALCEYLNTLTQHEPITSRIMECARQGIFMALDKSEEARPLSEDYFIRGLIWAQFYFPSDWFSRQTDVASRAIETSNTHKARVERVQWLGLFLAFRTEYIKFDVYTKTFLVPTAAAQQSVRPAEVKIASVRAERDSEVPTPKSRSSATLSVHTDSDGYNVVAAPKSNLTRTWASVASKPTKARQDYAGVKVVDHDDMQWEV